MPQGRRRGKSAKELQRRSATRAIPDRILIVSEGSKSEPEYFRALVAELGIATAKVRVCGESGSAPTSVVEYAEKTLAEDDDFEQIYLVFDRDGSSQRTNFMQAIAKVSGLARRRGFSKKVVTAITSVPCFEIWYLLHARPSARPYEDPAAGSSPAKVLISDLKNIKLDGNKVFASYEKSGCGDFYDTISSQRGEAIKRSKRILEEARKRGDAEYNENPSTRVHIVVEALEKLRKK